MVLDASKAICFLNTMVDFDNLTKMNIKNKQEVVRFITNILASNKDITFCVFLKYQFI